MFNNYHSLKASIEKSISSQHSVLNKFPENIARPITQSCAKHLAQFTSHQLPLSLSNSNSVSSTTPSNKVTTSELTSTQISREASNTPYSQSSITTASIVSSSNANTSQSSGDKADKTNIIELDTIEQVNWALEVLQTLFSSIV